MESTTPTKEIKYTKRTKRCLPSDVKQPQARRGLFSLLTELWFVSPGDVNETATHDVTSVSRVTSVTDFEPYCQQGGKVEDTF